MRELGKPAGLRPVPHIACPECGNRMRLALVEPDLDTKLRLTFDCQCEFLYRMSDAVARELEAL